MSKANQNINSAKKMFEIADYDWAHTIAYTAIHTAAKAYMNKEGYRPSSDSAHISVVRFLESTETDFALKKYAKRVNRMRRLRHRVTYDDYDIVDEETAENAIEAAQEFYAAVEKALTQATLD